MITAFIFILQEFVKKYDIMDYFAVSAKNRNFYYILTAVTDKLI